MIIIGIDPGTGIKSPSGLVCFDTKNEEIIWSEEIGSKSKHLQHKLKDISDKMEELFKGLQEQYPDELILVCIESFVMKGKGGETLQRLIGSIMGRLPYAFELIHVANTRVKKILGGTGKADKPDVAKGVAAYFHGKHKTAKHIEELINLKSWDRLDAFGIAIAGYELWRIGNV